MFTWFLTHCVFISFFIIYSGHLGKHYSLFERICSVMKALKIACDFLIEFPEAASPIINDCLVAKIKEVANNPPPDYFRVDPNIIKKSEALLDWFGMHKLLLSKYPIDVKLSYSDNLKKILED